MKARKLLLPFLAPVIVIAVIFSFLIWIFLIYLMVADSFYTWVMEKEHD